MTAVAELVESETEADYIASEAVASLERAWARAQQWEPELPRAYMVIGRGTNRLAYAMKPLDWEDYRPGQWALKEAGKVEHLAEVFIGGEALEDPAETVLVRLLRQAALLLADRAGEQVLSRQERYHNRSFVGYAEQVGLRAERRASGDGPSNGFDTVYLSNEARPFYRDQVLDIERNVRAYRDREVHLEVVTSSEPGEGSKAHSGPKSKAKPRPKPKDRRILPNTTVWAECQCNPPVTIRMAWGAFEYTYAQGQASMQCGACNAPFERTIEKPSTIAVYGPSGIKGIREWDSGAGKYVYRRTA